MLEAAGSADGVNLRNRQNGDTASPAISNGKNATFLIKYNTGEGGVKVERGLNIVDYTFYRCASTASCGPTLPLETGTVSFDVTYVEETLPGTSTVRLPCPTPSATP